MPYHRLDSYKMAYKIALEIHKLTLTFPKFEQYELGQQLRRASKSIAANIAEGMGKQESKLDVKRYMRIAIGSCDESRIWLEFARDLGYLEKLEQEKFDGEFQKIGRMLRGIIKHYNTVSSDT